MNKLKGCPLIENSSEESGSPSDVVFCIEKETNECKSSQNQNECTSKRKRSELEEDDSDKRIDNLTPDELLQIIYGTADEPMTEMPLSKDELTDIVCDMIILLNNDPASLETKWVRTNKPYQLSLTLKQLQDSLRTDQPMSKDLFDMNVRVMTIKEHKRLKRCNQPIWKHYMDLQFCTLTDFGRDPKYKKKVDAKQLAETFKSWTLMTYDISRCRFILMRNISADVVLQIMYGFNGTNKKIQINTDVRALRRKLLVEMLTNQGNTCRFIIPQNIQEYLTRIREE
ncbi:hypothetical protein EJB05_18783, partial [Eragrostis curvula]